MAERVHLECTGKGRADLGVEQINVTTSCNTVGEFIGAMLEEHKYDWGDIRIYMSDEGLYPPIYKLRFKRGALAVKEGSTIENEVKTYNAVKDSDITKIDAAGWYSCVNYKIYIN